MFDIIIGIAVVAVAVIITAKNKKKADNNGTPENRNENFPFPIPDLTIEIDKEDWLGRRVDEVVVVEDKKVDHNAKHKAALAKEFAKIDNVKAKVKTKPHQDKKEQNESIFEFDAEKAIIYSEIMQPKFKEY